MLALVLGSADCLLADVAEAYALAAGADPLVVACNDAGAVWAGRVDHWATLHPDKFGRWLEARASLGHAPAGRLWTYESGCPPAGVEVARLPDRRGGTGMLARDVARAAGADRVVLCGCPMTETPHIPGISRDQWRARPWPAARTFRRAWEAARGELVRDTRSVSGWTAELLGRPTPEWLEGREAA